MTMVHVLDDLDIPDEELEFSTSRSSGPGGQNVNKVNTRVTVLFDVERSAVLSEEQRELLRARLGGRISRAGVLRVVSQRHRTQLANRDAAVARLATLVREALSEQPERVPVKVPAAVKERRLEEKHRRGDLKRERGLPADPENY
jgi:ribosome-associated protein